LVASGGGAFSPWKKAWPGGRGAQPPVARQIGHVRRLGEEQDVRGSYA